MKGTLLVAIPIDTDQEDPAVALRVVLAGTRGVDRSQGNPQVIAKEFAPADQKELASKKQ